jgi:hypothetical protein
MGKRVRKRKERKKGKKKKRGIKNFYAFWPVVLLHKYRGPVVSRYHPDVCPILDLHVKISITNESMIIIIKRWKMALLILRRQCHEIS